MHRRRAPAHWLGRCSSGTTRVIDDAVGRAMAALGPDDLLLVVSGFGMEPMGLGPAAGRAGHRRSGAERHPRCRAGRVSDGVRRTRCARGRAQTRASVVDVDADRAVFSRACLSAATWTATRAPTSFSRPSPTSGRSRSYRRTIDKVASPDGRICGTAERKNGQQRPAGTEWHERWELTEMAEG